jgi:hypothetical protein
MPTGNMPTDELLTQLENAIQVQLRKEQAGQFDGVSHPAKRSIKVEPLECEPLEYEPSERDAQEPAALHWLSDIRIQQIIEATVATKFTTPKRAICAISHNTPRQAFRNFVVYFGYDAGVELVNLIKEALENAAVADMVHADEYNARVHECNTAFNKKAEALRERSHAKIEMDAFTRECDNATAAGASLIEQVNAGYAVDKFIIQHAEVRLTNTRDLLAAAKTKFEQAEAAYQSIIVPCAPPKFVPAPYAEAASFMDSCSCIPSTARPGNPADVWLVSTANLCDILLEVQQYQKYTLNTAQRNFIAAVLSEMRKRVIAGGATDETKTLDIEWLIELSEKYHSELIVQLRRDLDTIQARLSDAQTAKFDKAIADIMARN